MEPSQERKELGAFLRARRAELSPEALGLPRGPRRLTAGLRREEVAALACIGVTWYTWLEQGRDIHASPAVLDRIAKALRLSTSDRLYLFALATGQTKSAAPTSGALEEAFQRVLDSIDSTPAFIVNPRWDIIAFNRLADVLYDCSGYAGRYAENLLWRAFMDPVRRRLYVNWDQQIPRALGLFRANYASRVGDPTFEELLRDLRHASPEFVRLWETQHTEPLSPEPFEFSSDRLGRLSVHSTRFSIPTHPGFSMLVLVPSNEATAQSFANPRGRPPEKSVQPPAHGAQYRPAGHEGGG